MTTTADHMTTYRALLAGGATQADACRTMMRDHGLSLDDAASLAWGAVGQRQPSRDDHRANAAWYRGHYSRQCGE